MVLAPLALLSLTYLKDGRQIRSLIESASVSPLIPLHFGVCQLPNGLSLASLFSSGTCGSSRRLSLSLSRVSLLPFRRHLLTHSVTRSSFRSLKAILLLTRRAHATSGHVAFGRRPLLPPNSELLPRSFLHCCFSLSFCF
jgi:hypothetical protein